jgi:hypothetical protein
MDLQYIILTIQIVIIFIFLMTMYIFLNFTNLSDRMVKASFTCLEIQFIAIAIHVPITLVRIIIHTL